LFGGGDEGLFEVQFWDHNCGQFDRLSPVVFLALLRQRRGVPVWIGLLVTMLEKANTPMSRFPSGEEIASTDLGV
jgi:hypothetical protein